MTQLDRTVAEEFERCLARGDAAAAEKVMAAHLDTLPASPFHVVLDISITNSPREVAAYLDAGVVGAMEYRREVDPDSAPDFGAAYVEMNGFPENPDCWFFSFFAIFECGSPLSTSWLGDFFWSSETMMVITGLESAQRAYAANRHDWSYESMVAGHVVLAKFQDLIARALPHTRMLTMRMFASAHDGWSVFEARRA